MIPHLKKVWATEHIRKKILFTLLIVAIYKVMASIPVPGVNVSLLDSFTEQLRLNSQLSFFGSLMG
jgi:preprotein translocase subunit SecY